LVPEADAYRAVGGLLLPPVADISHQISAIV
jgi:hypothetical protein